jgi:hypothetical protein
MEEALKQGHEAKAVVDLGQEAPEAVAYRQEIDDFMLGDPLAFNLFLLASRKLHEDPEPMGYFQIAGIHGLPRRDWDGVKGPDLQFPAGGYCTHGMMVRTYSEQGSSPLIRFADISNMASSISSSNGAKHNQCSYCHRGKGLSRI